MASQDLGILLSDGCSLSQGSRLGPWSDESHVPVLFEMVGVLTWSGHKNAQKFGACRVPFRLVHTQRRSGPCSAKAAPVQTMSIFDSRIHFILDMEKVTKNRRQDKMSLRCLGLHWNVYVTTDCFLEAGSS